MNHPRLEMACATCLTPLNTLGDTYIHPIGFGTDHRHQPVPVPVTTLDTVRRTCDFCSDPYPIWTITGGDLTAVITSTTHDGGLVQNYGDRWATCAPCYHHIFQNQTDRLAQRALRAMPSLDSVAHSKIADLHRAFLAGLRPGRTLISTTAWPTTTITARDLPKVRDRLARLLRGPVALPAHFTVDRRDLADRLDQGRLYWADATFTDLAVTAAQSLSTTALHTDAIPGDTGILAFATPIADTAAITWTLRDTTIKLVRYRTIGGGLEQHHLQTVREDVGYLAPITTHTLRLGNNNDDAGHRARTAVVLATWLLMGQPATETPVADIDKRTRKRYERGKRRLPEVKLVRLRATGQSPAGTRQTEHLERAALAERVWVTGHWREQPYGPGRAQRRPVYIHPHLRSVDRTTGVSFNDAVVMAPTLTRTAFGRSVGHGSTQRGEPARHRGARGPQGGQCPGQRRPGAAVGRGGQRRSTGRAGQCVPA
ncbi:MAG TPA: hypothetical protein VF657_08995 [Actinoplanes sp.]|jgi:hypothetical protein